MSKYMLWEEQNRLENSDNKDNDKSILIDYETGYTTASTNTESSTSNDHDDNSDKDPYEETDNVRDTVIEEEELHRDKNKIQATNGILPKYYEWNDKVPYLEMGGNYTDIEGEECSSNTLPMNKWFRFKSSVSALSEDSTASPWINEAARFIDGYFKTPQKAKTVSTNNVNSGKKSLSNRLVIKEKQFWEAMRLARELLEEWLDLFKSFVYEDENEEYIFYGDSITISLFSWDELVKLHLEREASGCVYPPQTPYKLKVLGEVLQSTVREVLKESRCWPRCRLEEARRDKKWWASKVVILVYRIGMDDKNAEEDAATPFLIDLKFMPSFSLPDDYEALSELMGKSVGEVSGNKTFDPRGAVTAWHLGRGLPCSFGESCYLGTSLPRCEMEATSYSPSDVSLYRDQDVGSLETDGEEKGNKKKGGDNRFLFGVTPIYDATSWTARQILLEEYNSFNIASTNYGNNRNSRNERNASAKSVFKMLADIDTCLETTETKGLLGDPRKRRSEFDSQMWMRVRANSFEYLGDLIKEREPEIALWKNYYRYSCERSICMTLEHHKEEELRTVSGVQRLDDIRIIDTLSHGESAKILRMWLENTSHSHTTQTTDTAPPEKGERLIKVTSAPPLARYVFAVPSYMALDFISGCPECGKACRSVLYHPESSYCYMSYLHMPWVYSNHLRMALNDWWCRIKYIKCMEKMQRLGLPKSKLTIREEKERKEEYDKMSLLSIAETQDNFTSKYGSRCVKGVRGSKHKEASSYKTALTIPTLPLKQEKRFVTLEMLSNSIHRIGLGFGTNQGRSLLGNRNSSNNSEQGLQKGVYGEDVEKLWLQDPVVMARSIFPPCINAIISIGIEGIHPKNDARTVLLLFFVSFVHYSTCFDKETRYEISKSLWYECFKRDPGRAGALNLTKKYFFETHINGVEFVDKFKNAIDTSTGALRHYAHSCRTLALSGFCPFAQIGNGIQLLSILKDDRYGDTASEQGFDSFKEKNVNGCRTNAEMNNRNNNIGQGKKSKFLRNLYVTADTIEDIEDLPGLYCRDYMMARLPRNNDFKGCVSCISSPYSFAKKSLYTRRVRKLEKGEFTTELELIESDSPELESNTENMFPKRKNYNVSYSSLELDSSSLGKRKHNTSSIEAENPLSVTDSDEKEEEIEHITKEEKEQQQQQQQAQDEKEKEEEEEGEAVIQKTNQITDDNSDIDSDLEY